MAQMSTEAFQEVVLNNFHTASEQRKEDKKDFSEKFIRMEKKHTDTYTAVFKDIRENGEAIIANQTKLEGLDEDVSAMKKKSAVIGSGSGLGGGAIILALKEIWNSFSEGR